MQNLGYVAPRASISGCCRNCELSRWRNPDTRICFRRVRFAGESYTVNSCNTVSWTFRLPWPTQCSLVDNRNWDGRLFPQTVGVLMDIAKRVRMAAVAVIVTALFAASASAQQPTPSSPLNPNWCSSAPASPPPPQFEQRPGDWAEARQMCMNLPNADKGCGYICQTAKDLWNLQKLGRLNQRSPSPLPSGASQHVVPAHPAPTSSPAEAATSQSSLLSPGPFSSYSGAELNALKNHI